MALFMDVHTMAGGVNAADVAEAHQGGPEHTGQVRRELPAVMGPRRDWRPTRSTTARPRAVGSP